MALYAIDGTQSERVHLSNVYHFAKRYRDGIKSYWSGPGTPHSSIGGGLVASGTGMGALRTARQVVERIAADYNASEQKMPIDIVGFSRGAAIANQVATLLNDEGIVCDSGADLGDPFVRVPKVRFLGLFDPVHSMGMIVPLPDSPLFLANRHWNMHDIPANVQHSFVAYAKDERRYVFQPTRLLPPKGAARERHAQEYFRGAHSDVGGHVQNNPSLARIALRSMVLKAVEAGVKMDTRHLITDPEIAFLEREHLLKPYCPPASGQRTWAR